MRDMTSSYRGQEKQWDIFTYENIIMFWYHITTLCFLPPSNKVQVSCDLCLAVPRAPGKNSVARLAKWILCVCVLVITRGGQDTRP